MFTFRRKILAETYSALVTPRFFRKIHTIRSSQFSFAYQHHETQQLEMKTALTFCLLFSSSLLVGAQQESNSFRDTLTGNISIAILPPEETMVGTSYCTYAPDYDCYEKGWPECCDDKKKDACPTEQPPCDVASAPTFLVPGDTIPPSDTATQLSDAPSISYTSAPTAAPVAPPLDQSQGTRVAVHVALSVYVIVSFLSW